MSAKKVTPKVTAAARVIARAYGRDFDTDDIAKRAVRNAEKVTFSLEAKARAAQALRDEFTVEDEVGEYSATAVWATPEDIVTLVMSTLKART
jgi:hypothetical protein